MRCARAVGCIILLLGVVRGEIAYAATPCNPQATARAKQILDFLEGLPKRADNRVVSGQNVGHVSSIPGGYAKYIEQLHDQTQKWVALLGVDYGFSLDSGDIQTANQTIISHWKAGGIVTVSAHINNPFTGNDTWDTSSVDLVQLITSGTSANKAWMESLDAIAVGLAELRDAGVVVLWRPFHEMNGDWFWWSCQGSGRAPQQAFVNVWKHMFNYFTKTKGLNNLLWVYGPNQQLNAGSTASTTHYFPGKDFVDVVGMDIYQDDLSQLNANGSYDSLVALGKPLGITEFGPKSIMDGSFDNTLIIKGIKSYGPQVVFWLSWHSWTDANVAIIDNQNASALLNDPWVITRDELPFTAPAPDGGTTIPPDASPGDRPAVSAEGAAPKPQQQEQGCGCATPGTPRSGGAGHLCLWVIGLLIAVCRRGRARRG